MDSSTRSPKEFKTDNGVVFTLKPYLTGDESLEIELASTAGVNADTGGLQAGEVPKVRVNMSDMRRCDIHKKIEMTVVSVEGKSENILRVVLDLPDADFRFILAKVEEIVNPPKAT